MGNRLMPLAILLVALITTPGGLTSPSSLDASLTAVRDTASCLDTLQTSDSVLAFVRMTVRPQDSTTTLPSDFEGLFVQEVSSRLKVPGTLPLSVMGGWDQCDLKTRRCVGAVPMLGVYAYATAHPTAKLSRIAVIDGSLTPSFSDSVRRTLERIGQENGSPPFFNRTDSIPLKITIGVEQHSDTVHPYRNLFRIRLPHYNLPLTFAERPQDIPGPRFPAVAAQQGIGDTISVVFTVLPDGSINLRSVDIQGGRYINFMEAVFKNLSSVKYVPARLGGCPVATRAGQTFEFGIRR